MKKGAAALLASKLFFIAAGYVLYMALGRMLTTADFGLYGVVFGLVTIVNTVLLIGSMQTVSHFVAANPDAGPAVRQRGFLYQALIGIPLAAGFCAASPLIARVFHDPRMMLLLCITAPVFLAYALFAVNVGYLNGTRRFGAQAALDIVFQVLRLALILALVRLGYGLAGIIIGYVVATVLVLLLSFVPARGIGSQPTTLDFGLFLRFGFPAMAVALLFNLVLHADLFLVKTLATPAAVDTLAGFYTAAQSIARIPYHLLITASLVMFPAIASLKGDDDESRRLRADRSSRAMIAALGLLAGMAAVAIPYADRLLRLVYPVKFAPASPALAVLIAGMCVLTLLHLASSMISGHGRPGVSAAILAGALAVQVALAWWTIPKWGLTGAAAATTLSSFLFLIIAMGWMRSRFGTRVDLARAVKIALASLLTLGLSWGFRRLAPAGPLATLLSVSVIYGIHLIMLAATGVLGMNLRLRDSEN